MTGMCLTGSGSGLSHTNTHTLLRTSLPGTGTIRRFLSEETGSLSAVLQPGEAWNRPHPHPGSCCITAVQMERCHLHQHHHYSILLAAASLPGTRRQQLQGGWEGGWRGRIYPTQRWRARARARTWMHLPQPASMLARGESSCKQLVPILLAQPRLKWQQQPRAASSPAGSSGADGLLTHLRRMWLR